MLPSSPIHRWHHQSEVHFTLVPSRTMSWASSFTAPKMCKITRKNDGFGMLNIRGNGLLQVVECFWGVNLWYSKLNLCVPWFKTHTRIILCWWWRDNIFWSCVLSNIILCFKREGLFDVPSCHETATTWHNDMCYGLLWLIGGFKHVLFSMMYGIVLPIDELHHFSRCFLNHFKPPTSIYIYIYYGISNITPIWVFIPQLRHLGISHGGFVRKIIALLGDFPACHVDTRGYPIKFKPICSMVLE